MTARGRLSSGMSRTPLPRLAAALAIGLAGPLPAPAAEEAFPAALVAFGPASPEPVFAGGGPDAWDRDLRERGWIARDGDRWRLWYTGSNRDRDPVRRLGLATSRDGLNWTRAADQPLLPDAWVEDVCLARCRGGLLLFAEGRDDLAHRLVSRDGLRWRPCGPLDIRRADGRPLEPGPRGTPTVWWERGVWHLFYERGDRGVWLATSRDLTTFTNVRDDPVIACGPEAYDRHAVACDQIVRHGGRYYAYYHASDRPDWSAWCTCIAVSDDLVRWRKYPGNPVLPADPAHPKRSSATLVHDGRRHRLYTTHPDVRVRFAVEAVSPP